MIRLLFSAQLCICLIAAQDKGGSISGTVVDSITGAPLNKVTIQAESTNVTSDSEGHFKLADLKAGEYRLVGNRNGYLEATGKPITLESGQELKDVKVRMTPFGVIAGTVRDEDGEAILGVSVIVSRVLYEFGKRRAQREAYADTDDLGQYRIPNLAPGRYYVRARLDPAPARLVQVAAGERVTGIDIALTHTSGVRVTGHATVPAGTRLSTLKLRTGDDNLAFEVQGQWKQDGDFEFSAVPPGAYTLTAVASPPNRPSTEVFELFSQGDFKAQLPAA